MDFNVAQLLKETVGATRSYDVDEVATDPNDWGWRWVRGPVRLTRTRRGILAQAPLAAGYDGECSRCVAEFSGHLEFLLEEEFYPTIDVITGRPLAVPEDLDGFPIDSNHLLDLREAVRQGVLLAQSMAPLCRPDCAGLCVECGSDLNQGPCGCPTEEIDSRWSALAGLPDDPVVQMDVKEG